MKAEEKLKREIKSRKTGIVGFIRTLLAGNTAMSRVKTMQAVKDLKEKGFEVKAKSRPLKEPPKLLSQLTTHPLLKDKKIHEGDFVRTVSLRGNIRDVKVTGAIGDIIFVEFEGNPVTLRLNKLESIERL